MKALIIAIFLLAGRAFAADYWLEGLVADGAKHVAPAALQRGMAQFEGKRLRQTAETHQLSARALARYFAAVRIDLGDKQAITYLVFPARYSAAFFGTHAISYWLMEQTPAGSFKLLYSAADDGISIRPQRSQGRFDIARFYGYEVTHLRFDGQVYREAKD